MALPDGNAGREVGFIGLEVTVAAHDGLRR